MWSTGGRLMKEELIGKRVRIIDGEKTWAIGKSGVIENVIYNYDISNFEDQVRYVVRLDDMDPNKPPYGKVSFAFEEFEILPEKDIQEGDPVNHPSHYTDGKFEVIDFLETKGLWKNFYYANAVKYICRAGKKNPDKKQEDLNKAVWYLNRYLEFSKESLGISIDANEFIKDKGLDGKPGGIAISLILEDKPELAIEALKIKDI